MVEENPDFTTILPTFWRGGSLFCAAIRKYSSSADEYISSRVSNPMKKEKALSLAESWAATLGIHVRL